jgi:hypothetical protein
MRVRFRADNDLNRDIVRAVLRIRPEIDFESQQLHGLNDQAVLELAALEGSLLVTHAPEHDSAIVRHNAGPA